MCKYNLTPPTSTSFQNLTCISSANVFCTQDTHFLTPSNHGSEIAVVWHAPCSNPCKTKLVRNPSFDVHKIRDMHVSFCTHACLDQPMIFLIGSVSPMCHILVSIFPFIMKPKYSDNSEVRVWSTVRKSLDLLDV
jgi:hypothetical protein